MLRVLFTDSATRQSDEIRAWSEDKFGKAAADRYVLLLTRAVIDLAEEPGRRGVKMVEGRIHYHIRHSQVSAERQNRVGSPRHLVVAKVVGDALWILAFARDGMIDQLAQRIGQGDTEMDRGR